MIETRKVLEALGFTEDWNAITDKQPGYRYDFGNWVLTAAQSCNRFFMPSIFFGGVISTPRTLQMIESEMPLEVESFEQGVAWISHIIGNDYQPVRPVAWLEQGRMWKHLLPWNRKMEAYKARPMCVVESEWFRVAAKKLRALAEGADEDDLAYFSFDGEILRIDARDAVFAMPAVGKAWDQRYAIKARELDRLLKRFPSIFEISVWKERLSIASRSFLIAEPPPAGLNS